LLLAQSKTSEENSAAMSDRLQEGLRGSVKSVTEESIFPKITDPAGGRPEIRVSRTTEYDPGGHKLSIRNGNPDGSQWIARYEYSKSGQLLKMASGTEGQALAETTYSYDSKGRVEKISAGNKDQTPVTFRYDEHGRKTRIVTSTASDYRPNVATGGSPFEAAETPPNLPGGGTSSTIYDEHDRATEIQVRDSDGALVYRALRTYDAEGHISEETQVHDDLTKMFPPEARQQMLDESGLSAEQLGQEFNAQVTRLMKGQNSAYSVTYRYDSAGRLIHTSRRIFNQEDEIETTYNDRGDLEQEITRSTRPDENERNPAVLSYSEARYSYQYDQAGNWTEKTSAYRFSADSEFQTSTATERTLTYY
jgi:hypothetical protein